MSTSATQSASDNKIIRIGFVGLSNTGWASMFLAPSLLDPEVKKRYKLVAISTTNVESAAASARKYSELFGHEIKAYHGDASQIASDPEVDLVAIAVKVPNHKDIAKKAIAAGKSFFLEYQAGRTVEETRELARLAKTKGVRSLIGLQGRHSPAARKVKAIIDSGKIGRLLSVTANFLMPREFRAFAPETQARLAFAADKANGVSLISSPGGHIFDLFFQMFSQFSRIRAAGTTLYPTVTVVDDATGEPIGQTLVNEYPDHVTINGVLKDSGAWVTVILRLGHKSTPGRTQLLYDIDGEEGTLKIQDDRPMGMNMGAMHPEHIYLNGEELDWDTARDGEAYDNPVPFLKDNWLEFYKGKENGGNYVDIEDAVKIREFLGAIQTSVDEDGRWIEL